MAVADYFQRGAVAAAQAVDGFNEGTFRTALETATIGIGLGSDAAETAEGRLVADLTTRLLARFYPRLAIRAAQNVKPFADDIEALARRINPSIEVVADDSASIGIAIGNSNHEFEHTISVGSDEWLASVGRDPQPLGDSSNPFGAGAAACLACANVFRFLFLGGADQLDSQLYYSTYVGDTLSRQNAEQLTVEGRLPEPSVLVGAGAIGNAAAWALARAPITGTVYAVDPELIELSNLQRYVLAEREDEGRVKVNVLEAAFTGTLRFQGFQGTWADLVEETGYDWRYTLLALDTADDRITVQGSLPEHIINSWTQPGDLGVSVHDRFSGGVGACVSCLYLPSEITKNQDQIVAEALRIDDALQDVRRLLHTGDPPSTDLLDVIAQRLEIDRQALDPFESRPLTALYSDGICGGAVISLDRLGQTDAEIHVPLAHQSAFAGIQLAASFVRRILESEDDPKTTTVTRINLLQRLGETLSQSALKSDPRCICSDPDYLQRYDDKWKDASNQ